MSTLELEHIKHSGASGNALTTHSDGTITAVGNLNSPVTIANNTGSGIARLNLSSSSNDGYQHAGLGLSDGTNTAEIMQTTSGLHVSYPSGQQRLNFDANGKIEAVNSSYLKAPYLATAHHTDNSVYGFKRGNNNALSVSFPNNNTNTKIYGLTFTIPTTPGINHWTVYVHGTWTGQQPGSRLWGAVYLDYTSTGGANNNNGSEANNGWQEASWWESDLSVGAYTWQPSGIWTNVTAGSHEVELRSWSSASGGNAWRAGMAVMWWPAEAA